MYVLPGTNIRILEPVPALNYFDSQSIELPRSSSALEVWNVMMGHPLPLLKLAFRIRDAISSLFGVGRIGGFSGQPVHSVEVGDFLDFFLVEYADDQCLVLTERDRHLDVMTCLSLEDRVATITSSVRTHNLFGRVYMLPVAPAHRWIVRSMLKRLSKTL